MKKILLLGVVFLSGCASIFVDPAPFGCETAACRADRARAMVRDFDTLNSPEMNAAIKAAQQ